MADTRLAIGSTSIHPISALVKPLHDRYTHGDDSDQSTDITTYDNSFLQFKSLPLAGPSLTKLRSRVKLTCATDDVKPATLGKLGTYHYILPNPESYRNPTQCKFLDKLEEHKRILNEVKRRRGLIFLKQRVPSAFSTDKFTDFRISITFSRTDHSEHSFTSKYDTTLPRSDNDGEFSASSSPQKSYLKNTQSSHTKLSKDEISDADSARSLSTSHREDLSLQTEYELRYKQDDIVQREKTSGNYRNDTSLSEVKYSSISPPQSGVGRVKQTNVDPGVSRIDGGSHSSAEGIGDIPHLDLSSRSNKPNSAQQTSSYTKTTTPERKSGRSERRNSQESRQSDSECLDWYHRKNSSSDVTEPLTQKIVDNNVKDHDFQKVINDGKNTDVRVLSSELGVHKEATPTTNVSKPSRTDKNLKEKQIKQPKRMKIAQTSKKGGKIVGNTKEKKRKGDHVMKIEILPKQLQVTGINKYPDNKESKLVDNVRGLEKNSQIIFPNEDETEKSVTSGQSTKHSSLGSTPIEMGPETVGNDNIPRKESSSRVSQRFEENVSDRSIPTRDEHSYGYNNSRSNTASISYDHAEEEIGESPHNEENDALALDGDPCNMSLVNNALNGDQCNMSIDNDALNGDQCNLSIDFDPDKMEFMERAYVVSQAGTSEPEELRFKRTTSGSHYDIARSSRINTPSNFGVDAQDEDTEHDGIGSTDYSRKTTSSHDEGSDKNANVCYQPFKWPTKTPASVKERLLFNATEKSPVYGVRSVRILLKDENKIMYHLGPPEEPDDAKRKQSVMGNNVKDAKLADNMKFKKKKPCHGRGRRKEIIKKEQAVERKILRKPAAWRLNMKSEEEKKKLPTLSDILRLLSETSQELSKLQKGEIDVECDDVERQMRDGASNLNVEIKEGTFLGNFLTQTPKSPIANVDTDTPKTCKSPSSTHIDKQTSTGSQRMSISITVTDDDQNSSPGKHLKPKTAPPTSIDNRRSGPESHNAHSPTVTFSVEEFKEQIRQRVLQQKQASENLAKEQEKLHEQQNRKPRIRGPITPQYVVKLLSRPLAEIKDPRARGYLDTLKSPPKDKRSAEKVSQKPKVRFTTDSPSPERRFRGEQTKNQRRESADDTIILQLPPLTSVRRLQVETRMSSVEEIEKLEVVSSDVDLQKVGSQVIIQDGTLYCHMQQSINTVGVANTSPWKRHRKTTQLPTVMDRTGSKLDEGGDRPYSL